MNSPVIDPEEKSKIELIKWLFHLKSIMHNLPTSIDSILDWMERGDNSEAKTKIFIGHPVKFNALVMWISELSGKNLNIDLCKCSDELIWPYEEIEKSISDFGRKFGDYILSVG